MAKPIEQDPLHEILERHLFRSGTEGEHSPQMVQAVVDDYIEYLKSKGAHIPVAIQGAFIEDIKIDIREFVIKRTFGSLLPEPTKENLDLRKNGFNKKDI